MSEILMDWLEIYHLSHGVTFMPEFMATVLKLQQNNEIRMFRLEKVKNI